MKPETLLQLKHSCWNYLPPEIVGLIYQTKFAKKSSSIKYPDYGKDDYWQIDVWSAGIVLLEIAVGYPVWINTKVVIKHHSGRQFLSY